MPYVLVRHSVKRLSIESENDSIERYVSSRLPPFRSVGVTYDLQSHRCRFCIEHGIFDWVALSFGLMARDIILLADTNSAHHTFPSNSHVVLQAIVHVARTFSNKLSLENPSEGLILSFAPLTNGNSGTDENSV
jgi:hypothetical protein